MTEPDTTAEWALEHDAHKGTIHEHHHYTIIGDEATAVRQLALVRRISPAVYLVRRQVTAWERVEP